MKHQGKQWVSLAAEKVCKEGREEGPQGWGQNRKEDAWGKPELRTQLVSC